MHCYLAFVGLFLFARSGAALLLQQLPNFLSDSSDVVLSAVLERSENGPELHLVVMMMGHKAFFYMPQSPILMMNRSAMGVWGRVASNFAKTRLPSATNCSFGSNGNLEVPGSLLPSSTSIDTGFNRNLELLRCPVPVSALAGNNHREREQKLEVSLVRKGQVLLSFSISVRKRQAGYGFTLSRKSSRINMWQQDSKSLNNKAFLCTSVIRPLEPWRPDVALPLLLEFVEHNVQIGFAHQFLATFLDPRSVEFQHMLALLRPYIEKRQVSLTGLAIPRVNDYSGVLGLIFIDDYTRYIHQNQCLYISRGLASHVAMLQASEFLALGPRYDNIAQLLQTLPRPLSLANGRRPCFYKVYTLGVADPPDKPPLAANSQFLRDHYTDSRPFGPLPAFNVAILPVHNIHSVAWHDAASCSGPSRSVADAVTLADAHFIPMSEAAVYFYRQSKFDPWQLKRASYDINNHTLRYGRSAEHELFRKGIVARGDAPGSPLRFPALETSTVHGEVIPKGREYVIHKGMVECQPASGCKNFGSLFNLQQP